MSPFAHSIFKRTYAFYPNETWEECARRVAKNIASNPQQEEQFYSIIKDRIFIPGGRYLYSAGRPKQMYQNCYAFSVDDSREGWATLLHDVTMCLSTGGGLGVNYSKLRESGSPIYGTGGKASGPIALMQMVNEVARHVMAGGSRRSALWAGLDWRHPDVEKFISIKQWDNDIRGMKQKSFEYPAPLDMTNISVLVDDEYFQDLNNPTSYAFKLHEIICRAMIQTGEPGFANMSRTRQDDPDAISFNACTEIPMHNKEACNIGSIVMPRIKDTNHLAEVTELATQFLYNGSLRTGFPTKDIADTVGRNRRLGLGMMGLHEWMIMQGTGYRPSKVLENWLSVWRDVSNHTADWYSRRYGARPIALRAWAPTGTISIIAETTSGIEPIYCKAYKRRYLDGTKHYFQYVIDPAVKRLQRAGIPHNQIEDSRDLSDDIERRLQVQTLVQQYTDNAISSTINIPAGTSELYQKFNHLSQKYMPSLKGLTVYPSGARAGEPLSPVSIDEASNNVGVVFEEDSEKCQGGVCGL
jgi:ribonucleoside-diphosphate reductase alpha chain